MLDAMIAGRQEAGAIDKAICLNEARSIRSVALLSGTRRRLRPTTLPSVSLRSHRQHHHGNGEGFCSF
jgi:hypothetical protein